MRDLHHINQLDAAFQRINAAQMQRDRVEAIKGRWRTRAILAAAFAATLIAGMWINKAVANAAHDAVCGDACIVEIDRD